MLATTTLKFEFMHVGPSTGKRASRCIGYPRRVRVKTYMVQDDFFVSLERGTLEGDILEYLLLPQLRIVVPPKVR